MKLLLKIIKFLIYIIMALLLILLIVLAAIYISGKSIELVSSTKFNESFSQIVSLSEKDEYVIAELVNNETFQKNQVSEILGEYVVGTSNARLSVVANYKYYIKLSEISHRIDDRTLEITVPRLYLQTPVAFQTSTIRETGDEDLLGTDADILLGELRKELSLELMNKGLATIPTVREKASASIANNFNSFFSSNGMTVHYDDIKIVYSDDDSQLYPVYSYHNGPCGVKRCWWENIKIGEKRSFIIDQE